jgi:peroxiredoxin
MHRRTITALVFVLICAVALPGPAELLEPGRTAPDFSLKTVDGETIRLSDLRGQVVVVEFWATWCGWCRRQMPAMVEAHARHGERAVFLMVNTAESAAAVERFTRKHAVPGTILLDPDDAVGEAYGTETLPAVVVIDGKGVVRAAVSGAMRDVEAFFDVVLAGEERPSS